jgi:hypothetical protein
MKWTQRQNTGPSPRGDFAMAYDSARQRTVLFGGATSSGPDATVFGDTWEWDGENWVQVADFGPQPRRSHAMAYDENQARVALFGGATKTALLSDTWAWDGETWVQVADTGPPPRSTMAMASDTKRKRIVLHGGNRIGPVPSSSIYHRGKHQPNIASEMSECLPDDWLEVQRGMRAPSLLEQVYMQRDGYALILLQLVKPDEDEEEEEERDLERSWSPRFQRR